MQLKAKVVVSLYEKEGSPILLGAWKNMLLSLTIAHETPSVRIDHIRYELKKFEADYDGSPYLFFYNERKYELWQLKFSSVCNCLDTAA